MTITANNIKINRELQLAYNYIQETGTSIFLTGKAGTGKTTFLKNIRDNIAKRMIVLAPTGVAAINAAGVTIHSFFQLPFCPFIPGLNYKDYSTELKFNREKIKIIKSIDLIVIDEISMVRPDVLDAMDNALKKYRDKNKPFGGIQLLMIGDLQQLSPVIKDEDWDILKNYYDTPFFFSSIALKQINYVCIELIEIFRQTDKTFIDILGKIRDKQLDDNIINTLNERYIPDFTPDDNEGYITLTTHNATAKEINEIKMNCIDEEEYIFNAEIEGDFPEYSYPTEQQLILKKGCQVMFVKNDSCQDKRYFNGKIGIVCDISDNSVTVQCNNDDNYKITVETAEWKNVKYAVDNKTKEIVEEEIGSFKQLPLKLAWAITIHKSQGLTFDKVIIDAQAAFAHGQVYVAFSRCKTLQGIVLRSKINKHIVFKDINVDNFTETMHNNQPDESTLINDRSMYFVKLLSEQFDFTNLFTYFKTIYNILNASYSKSYPELVKRYATAIISFENDINSVSKKFISIIDYYVQDETKIHERVKKGAAYFIEKCTEIVDVLLKQTDVDTDSKDIEKFFKNNYNRCVQEWRIKKATLQHTAEQGFTVCDYLNIKNKTQLESEFISKAEKKSKKLVNSNDIKNPRLYSILIEWRNAEAIINNIPVYTVIMQKAIADIANTLPVTNKELLQISGIGKAKLAKYGSEIIEIVNEYMQDMHITK